MTLRVILLLLKVPLPEAVMSRGRQGSKMPPPHLGPGEGGDCFCSEGPCPQEVEEGQIKEQFPILVGLNTLSLGL